MLKIICLITPLLFLLAMSACAPIPVPDFTEEPISQIPFITDTLVPSPSSTPTLTQTPTFTPSPSLPPTQTITPVPTKTPTPSPTPIGGGLGQIAFSGPAGIETIDLINQSRQPLGIWGSWLNWFSQGKVIAYMHYLGGNSPSREICDFNLVTRQESCLNMESRFPGLPFSLSSDQKTIAFGSRSSDGEDIYIIVPSNNNQRLIPGGDNPTWSPDGTRIAFTQDGRIYTMNADGSESSLLIATSGNSGLSWSPRGDTIAFLTHKTGNGDVYMVDLDGMQTRLSTSSNYDGYIAWSPDGTKLAYISAYNMSYSGLFGDVFVLDFTDNSNRQITTAIGATSASPSWSPDSQWLTFGACKSGQSEASCAIFIVNADGSGLQQVTDYDQYEVRPAWRP